MFILGMLQWWYGAGWRACVSRSADRLRRTTDFFSIDLLGRTLFAPFRQISAGRVEGTLGVQLHAFFDRLVSRCIGAMVRTVLIVIGVVSLGVSALGAGTLIIAWGVVPFFPIAGILLTVLGVHVW